MTEAMPARVFSSKTSLIECARSPVRRLVLPTPPPTAVCARPQDRHGQPRPRFELEGLHRRGHGSARGPRSTDARSAAGRNLPRLPRHGRCRHEGRRRRAEAGKASEQPARPLDTRALRRGRPQILRRSDEGGESIAGPLRQLGGRPPRRAFALGVRAVRRLAGGEQACSPRGPASTRAAHAHQLDRRSLPSSPIWKSTAGSRTETFRPCSDAAKTRTAASSAPSAIAASSSSAARRREGGPFSTCGQSAKVSTTTTREPVGDRSSSPSSSSTSSSASSSSSS